MIASGFRDNSHSYHGCDSWQLLHQLNFSIIVVYRCENLSGFRHNPTAATAVAAGTRVGKVEGGGSSVARSRLKLGPGRHCSPHRPMTSNTIHEGSHACRRRGAHWSLHHCSPRHMSSRISINEGSNACG